MSGYATTSRPVTPVRLLAFARVCAEQDRPEYRGIDIAGRRVDHIDDDTHRDGIVRALGLAYVAIV
jgi:hypothetical protein